MNKPNVTTKLVVRNLSPRMTAEGLSSVFSAHGAVRSVRLATDIMTGCCRGFGFISLDELETGAAIDALDGSSVGGRVIRVAVDRKPERVQR